jgi:hypothetical protein
MTDNLLTNQQEGDLQDFIKYVFGGEIHPPTGIQFLGEFSTTKELFEALLMIFTGGMKLRYGNDQGIVDLNQLTGENLDDIHRRFASINLSVGIFKYHHAQIHAVRNQVIPEHLEHDWLQSSDNYPEITELHQLQSYREVSSDKLSDYYFQLVNGYNYYIISFQYLR